MLDAAAAMHEYTPPVVLACVGVAALGAYARAAAEACLRALLRATVAGAWSSEQAWADADGQMRVIIQTRHREATRCFDWM